jgi:hypothetical protein
MTVPDFFLGGGRGRRNDTCWGNLKIKKKNFVLFSAYATDLVMCIKLFKYSYSSNYAVHVLTSKASAW